MRILWITPYLPSLIRSRSFNFIKALSDRGHDIHLVALSPLPHDLNAIDLLRQRCIDVETVRIRQYQSYWNCFSRLLSPMALQAAYYVSPTMRERITALLANHPFDVLHVEHLQASALVPERRQLPTVFDAVDCITALYAQFARQQSSWFARLLSKVEQFKLSTYEPRVARSFHRVVVTSETDRQELRRLAPELPVEVVTNGVDLAYFTPSPLSSVPTLLLSGKMSYYANEAAAVFFCQRILPLVRQALPQTKLVIAGSNPSKSLQKLCRSFRVEITGHVSDLRPLFRKARVAVCPITIGTGVQNKVLEAMAMGKPVVATSKACRTLSVRDGLHLCIADEPVAFAQAVVRLLTDDTFASGLAGAGRAYVELYHTWDDQAIQLEHVYEQAQQVYQESRTLRSGHLDMERNG